MWFSCGTLFAVHIMSRAIQTAIQKKQGRPISKLLYPNIFCCPKCHVFVGDFKQSFGLTVKLKI